MKLGICGSHRTGKTTLAQAIADKTGINLLKTDTNAIFVQQGLHPSQPLDFPTRLKIQKLIIQAAVKIWQTDNFVTDRTPIDFMAYTLADIQGNTEVDFIELEAYLTECFMVTNQIFSKLIVIQPAIPLVYESGKAALNKSYMEHLNIIVQGLCYDERLQCPVTVIQRNIIALKERVSLGLM
ncbi:AAA family ATPase [Candidatus Halobeggiatoa sp. HSG11]|nr:AAA family ATPase [Candidatus Halobeggiatoa sp. HSG11]